MSRAHSSFLGNQMRVADSWVNHEMVTMISPDCKSSKVKDHYMKQSKLADPTY